MSPEQAKGSKVSSKADLYSLGCMIFELLSGRPPFDGKDFMSVLISHVRDPAPHLAPMTPWGESIPDALRNAVYKSLSKDPEERAADASSMLRSIQGAPEPEAPTESAGDACDEIKDETPEVPVNTVMVIGGVVLALIAWWLVG